MNRNGEFNAGKQTYSEDQRRIMAMDALIDANRRARGATFVTNRKGETNPVKKSK